MELFLHEYLQILPKADTVSVCIYVFNRVKNLQLSPGEAEASATKLKIRVRYTLKGANTWFAPVVVYEVYGIELE